MRTVGWVLVAAGCATALIALGSRPPVPPVDARAIAAQVPTDPEELDSWLRGREDAAGSVLSGTEAEIRWAGLPGTRTSVAIVYLHGFSASRGELHPTLDLVGDDLGANVVYARLHGHGLDEGDLSQVSAAAWLADGERAYQVASRVGDRVVIVATSTGVDLGVDLMARHRWDPALAGAVFTSPNLGVRNPLAELLVAPWGAPVITTFMRRRCSTAPDVAPPGYWTSCYDTGAVVAMQDLIASTRHIDPASFRRPVRVLYNPDDPVVDVQYARRVLSRAPDARFVEVTSAEGEDEHVLAGEFKSPSKTEPTRQLMVQWIREMLRGEP